MDAATLALVILLVFVTGLLFAPLGLGGGIFFVPILHYVAGWPINGGLLIVSLALVTVVSHSSGLAHRREGHWSPEARNTALTGAIPGAIVGVVIVVVMGDRMDIVFKVISVVIIAWAIQKTWMKSRDEKSDGGNAAEVPEIDSTPLAVASSIGGLISAVLGIGAGGIYIPVLRQYAHLEARTANGTSFGVMMVVVPIALVAHALALSSNQSSFLMSENILLFAPLTMLATFFGAKLGAKVGLKFLPTKVLTGIFLGLLIFIWFRYAIDLASIFDLI